MSALRHRIYPGRTSRRWVTGQQRHDGKQYCTNYNGSRIRLAHTVKQAGHDADQCERSSYYQTDTCQDRPQRSFHSPLSDSLRQGQGLIEVKLAIIPIALQSELPRHHRNLTFRPY
jgi:hypothetical protein